jgi:hypothetical protein
LKNRFAHFNQFFLGNILRVEVSDAYVEIPFNQPAHGSAVGNPCKENNRLRRFIKHNPCGFWQVHTSPPDCPSDLRCVTVHKSSLKHLTERRFIMA